MALTITKLNAYQYWAKRDSTYKTAQTLHKVYTVSTNNTFTSSTHGLVDGDIVRVGVNGAGATLATPLDGEADYYVINSATNTFKLSTSLGGSEVDILDTGVATQWIAKKTLTFTCTDFPAGVFSVGDEIQLGSEYLMLTAVDDAANTLTATRVTPAFQATNKAIFFAAFPTNYDDLATREGDHISNQTRAGEATIVSIATKGFGADSGMLTMKFLVISGSFQAYDHIHSTRGGAFNIGNITATATTEETILVTGTMSDTDSGTTLAANCTASATTVSISLYSNLVANTFIRVGTEYMFIENSADASPDTMLVVRGVLGSTAASHTSGDKVYIVDTNLGEQILDADTASIRTNTAAGGAATTITLDAGASAVDNFYKGNTITILSGTGYGQSRVITGYVGGTQVATVATWTTNPDNTSIFKITWGLSNTTNGRIQLDCHLMLGRSDNAGQTVLISSGESLDLTETTTNKLNVHGNATYPTNLSFGIGFFDTGSRVFTGYSLMGSTIKCNSFDTYYGSTLFLFSSSVKTLDSGTPLKIRGSSYIKDLNIWGGFAPFNETAGKLYNATIYDGYFNISTSLVDISKLYSQNKNSEIIYWVYALGNAELWEFETPDSFSLTAGFIAGGNKVFVNCKTIMGDDTFWGGEIFYHKKTFDCKVLDEFGNLLEGVQVKCNYRVDKTDNVFTVLTGVDGTIAQQQVQFYEYETNSGAPIETRDIEYFITKSGYRTLRGRINIQDRDNPIVLRKVMKKNRFREEKSI